MGFRFRKSVKIGPARINLSKSGIGYSVGTKGLRFTKKAGGGTRTTASIPGTGISYVKDSSGTRKASSAAAYDTGPELTPAGSGGDRVTLTEVLLAWLLGWAGGHKFYRRKFGMGILYFFTFGLLCIGWFGDALWLTLRFVMQSRGSEPPKAVRAALFVAAVVMLASIGACQKDPTAQTAAQKPLNDLAQTAAAVQAENTAGASSQTKNPAASTDAADAEASYAAATVTAEPAAETTIPEPTEPEPSKLEYVLNTSSMRFHSPSCKSVEDIADANRRDFTGTRDEVISKGYQPCGNCHP